MPNVAQALERLAEILILAGTAGPGIMAPPTRTSISARLKCFGSTVHPRVWVPGAEGEAEGGTPRAKEPKLLSVYVPRRLPRHDIHLGVNCS